MRETGHFKFGVQISMASTNLRMMDYTQRNMGVDNNGQRTSPPEFAMGGR